jgi:hypothetical protein
MTYDSSGTGSGKITRSGTTALQFATGSDERLKENIRDTDAEESARRIAAMRVVDYDKHDHIWFTPGVDIPKSKDERGLIAQELKDILPEAVSYQTPPTDEHPDPLLEIGERAFLFELLNAVKWLTEERDGLISRVDALERAASPPGSPEGSGPS